MKPSDTVYSEIHHIENYHSAESFPVIDASLDGLVYFPGTINLKPFARLTNADFQRDFEINTLGAASFIQAYLNNVKKSPAGSIVLISSVAAQVGIPFHASISMAKGAVEGLTKALAAELSPGIRVNCIAPSLVDTPMALKLVDNSDKMEQMKKRNPMRKVGEALDIASAISFLLLKDSSWITGQVLAVDGGMNTLKN
jgi:3-oxoacyl-[acyl-carrier protein] reductase